MAPAAAAAAAEGWQLVYLTQQWQSPLAAAVSIAPYLLTATSTHKPSFEYILAALWSSSSFLRDGGNCFCRGNACQKECNTYPGSGAPQT
jgi:hypothetical protein